MDATDGIFSTLQRLNPHPQTELYYTNPYTLLVAVVLSAQSTDKGVNKATASLFKAVDTPTKMLDLGYDGLVGYIRSIGLYSTKAKHIIGLSNLLLSLHAGRVPLERVALEALPGVGRKTANVVLSTLTDAAYIAVDTHVFRVAHRLGFSKGSTPLQVEKDLLALIPPIYLHDAHHWLVLHGRYVCKAQKPLCVHCPISPYCPSVGLFG